MKYRIQNSEFRIRPAAPAGGFTLIELLVVVGIIIVLMAILLPTVGLVRRVACRSACQAQITALDGSIQQYHLDQNAYPEASGWGLTCYSTGTTPALFAYNTNRGNPTAGVSETEGMLVVLMGGVTDNLQNWLLLPTVCKSLENFGKQWGSSHTW